MSPQLQAAVVAIIVELLGADLGTTPAFLMRPGKEECGERWPLVRAIYRELTGLELRETMPPRERRTVDACLLVPDEAPRVLEVDERQHFNLYRARTLRYYADQVPLAFDSELWVSRSERPKKLEGGGFAVPREPLFPGEAGRHRQRAFRDALADILPPLHGWQPTLRIADFEVKRWIGEPQARDEMRALLAEKLY